MIQEQCINYILQSKDSSFITINNLSNEFFSDYCDEFNFIKTHLENYGSVPDLETFVNKFQDFDIIQVNEPRNYLLDQLYEEKNKRHIASIFNEVRELLLQDKTEEAISRYTNAVQDVIDATHMDCVDIFKDKSRYDAYVDRMQEYSKYYVPTGFKELDDIIGGWDREEELATIVARTNQGKSWILLKCAIAAAQNGLNVGIYSGEMSERKVGYRIDTLISHISNGSIIHGDSTIQNEYKKYIDSMDQNIKGSIKVLTPAMISGGAGVTALRAFIEKEKLDMLCIDQHSLLEDDRKAKNPVERASNISRDLKNLQVLKKIPIIAVSQQNRNSTDSGVDATHIAQSDRIGQDSTIIIFFENKDGILTITLGKSRDSENGKKLKYVIDFNKGIFKYQPMEDDAKQGDECEQLRQEYEGGEDIDWN